MTLLTATRNSITSFTSAQRIAQLLHRIQHQYVGRAVVEVMPNGSEWAGVIERMEWDASICGVDEDGKYCEGAWACYVRYSDNDGKFGSWTTCDVLKLV